MSLDLSREGSVQEDVDMYKTLELSETEQRAREIIHRLEDLSALPLQATKKGSSKFVGWEVLAKNEIKAIKHQYSSVKDQIEAKSRLISALFDCPRQAFRDPDNFLTVQTLLLYFVETMNVAFRDLELQYIEDLQGIYIECNLTPWLEKAYKVLKNCSEFLSTVATTGKTVEKRLKVSWTEVSCALALVSGRTPLDLHTPIAFRQVDNYEVCRRGNTISFQTLVPAKLVSDGIAFLDWAGRRYDDAKTSHDACSNKLSIECRENWMIFDDEVLKTLGKDLRWTFTKFSWLYFAAMVRNLVVEGFEEWEAKAKAAAMLEHPRPEILELMCRVRLTKDSKTRI